MKKTVSLFAMLFVAFSVTAAAQMVLIGGEPKTYTRPDPVAEHKRTFTINHITIEEAPPAIAKKIENLLDYEKAFDFTIQEEMTELQWLEEADFEVSYNRNGILSVALFITGSAAYPDSVTKRLNIDSVRGVRLFPKDVFVNMPALARLVKRKQTAEIAEAKKMMRKDPDSQDLDPNETFARANFTAKELNAFQVTESGVTFYYDYGFPHVAKALEPDGQYHFRWNELRRFVKKGSLLERASR